MLITRAIKPFVVIGIFDIGPHVKEVSKPTLQWRYNFKVVPCQLLSDVANPTMIAVADLPIPKTRGRQP